jgi:hypothetical protein
LAVPLCVSLAGGGAQEEAVVAQMHAYLAAEKECLMHELYSSADADQNDLHPAVKDDYLHDLLLNSFVCGVLIL